jgi:hypothetical protein
LGNAIFGADAIVMVQGRRQSYFERVVIRQPVHVMGSGSFAGLGGKVYHGRTKLMPLVVGGFQAINVTGAVEIRGFEIVGNPNQLPVLGDPGIIFENVAYGIIHQNLIHDVPYVGIEVHAIGSTSFVHIANNSVVNATAVGIYLSADGATPAGPTSFLSAIVESNTVIGSANGIAVGSLHFAAPGPVAFGNYIVRNNTVLGNDSGGIILNSFGATQSTVVVGGNVVQRNGAFEIGASTGNGSSLLLISDDTLSNTVQPVPGGKFFDSTNVGFGPQPQGFILINGINHPANTDLP